METGLPLEDIDGPVLVYYAKGTDLFMEEIEQLDQYLRSPFIKLYLQYIEEDDKEKYEKSIDELRAEFIREVIERCQPLRKELPTSGYEIPTENMENLEGPKVNEVDEH